MTDSKARAPAAALSTTPFLTPDRHTARAVGDRSGERRRSTMGEGRATKRVKGRTKKRAGKRPGKRAKKRGAGAVRPKVKLLPAAKKETRAFNKKTDSAYDPA